MTPKKKQKIHKFLEPLYKAPIYFVCDCSSDEAKKIFNKEIGPFPDIRWGNVGHSFQFVGEDGSMSFCLWIKDMKSLHVFTHEIFHLTCFILENRGIKFSMEYSDEAYAYLIEELFINLMEKRTNKS